MISTGLKIFWSTAGNNHAKAACFNMDSGDLPKTRVCQNRNISIWFTLCFLFPIPYWDLNDWNFRVKRRAEWCSADQCGRYFGLLYHPRVSEKINRENIWYLGKKIYYLKIYIFFFSWFFKAINSTHFFIKSWYLELRANSESHNLERWKSGANRIYLSRV